MDEQQKTLIKEVLKEMFECGEIAIKVDQKDKWDARYLVVTVDIDVYEHEEYIGKSGWSDN